MKKIILTIILIIFLALFKADSVKAQTCPNVPSNTGSVIFSTTTTAGTYRVWSRMKASDANNNSFYLKIDNNCAVLVGDSSQISNTNLTWVDYQGGNPSNKINVTLTAGGHVITLYGNELGTSIDKVLLTKNPSCLPANFGTNCPAELPTSTSTPPLNPSNTPIPASTSTPGNPKQTLSPDEGPAGTSVTIGLTGFPIGSSGSIMFDTTPIATYTVDANGGGSLHVTIPVASGGNHQLATKSNNGTIITSRTFIVSGSAPTITPTVTPTSKPTTTPTRTPTSPPSSSFNQLYVAENSSLSSPMSVAFDSLAIGGAAISPLSGTSTNPTREASLNISVPNTGTYYLWARLFGPSFDNDALYVGIDKSWDRIFPIDFGRYEWVRVETNNNSGSFGFNLTAGSHTIQVGHGEPLARLDSFYITSSANDIPTFGPSVSPPPPSPTPSNTVLNQGDGLLGMYYNNKDLGGLPLYRIDPNVNFDWKYTSPMSAIPTNNFSVRWTGYVVPEKSETYTFYGRSDDGIRVWVNNTLVVNGWYDHSAKEFSGSVALTANKKYIFRVEFYENSGGASAKVSWSSNSIKKEIIPKSRLYSFN